MKVIVTGGAGFIGSHIVDALLDRGHSPFVIDDFSSGDRRNLPSHVPIYEVDIRDGAKLARIFDEIRPDAVSHQAAGFGDAERRQFGACRGGCGLAHGAYSSARKTCGGSAAQAHRLGMRSIKVSNPR